MNPTLSSKRDKPTECEVLIIGSGAGGSSVALELAAAGHQVLILEEGSDFKSEDISNSTPADNLRRLYRSGGLVPIFGRPTIAYGEGRCVGGTTEINGGIFWEPNAETLDRWAQQYLLKSYRQRHLEAHVENIKRRLHVTTEHSDGGNRDSLLLGKGASALGWKWGSPSRAARGCVNLNQCTTGCPVGAKSSMSVTYLPLAQSYGALIVPDTRAIRLEHSGGRVHRVLAQDQHRRRFWIHPKVVFAAAGPIGTAALLRRSRVHHHRVGRRTNFHVNLRTVARFAERVSSDHGTIFTAQVHEFRDRGVLIMPSNVTPGGLGAAVAGHGPDLVQRLVDSFDYLAVYTTQIQMSGYIRLLGSGRAGDLLCHGMTKRDFTAVTQAFQETAKLLLSAGAIELIPPVGKTMPLHNLAEVEDFCARVRPGDWELVSVHGMSSCRMGAAERGGICDESGRPYGFGNLRVCDASILPGSTTVSPQGTIMAFAHEIASRYHNAR
jgi:choline dehydrogenase-like flavoprotein